MVRRRFTRVITRITTREGMDMDSITVDKGTLIERLEHNRTEHVEIFAKAQAAYRAQMIAELDRALDEAKNGGKIRRSFSLPVPEDHTEDFDTVLAMLNMDQGDTVQLTWNEFRTYVENDWGWQHSFAANTRSYLADQP